MHFCLEFICLNYFYGLVFTGHHPGGMVPGMGRQPGGMGPGPGGMGPGGGGGHSANVSLMRKLELALKSPINPGQNQNLMELLKRHPALMAAYMKRKTHDQSMDQHQQQHPQHGGPPHMVGSGAGQLPPQMGRQDMWHHRQAPPMQPSMYSQQPQNPGGGGVYQQQMPGRGPMLPPNMPPQQYSMVGGGGQPRYHAPNDPSAMGMQGHPQGMRGNAVPNPHHNQLLHQVRSPTSMPQHTRSPQPTPSPRGQHGSATASPALLQQGDPGPGMGAMMRPRTPGGGPPQYNPAGGGGMQQQPGYGPADPNQQYSGMPAQPTQQRDKNGAGGSNNQGQLTSFVDSL